MTGTREWTFSAPDHYFDYLADSEAVTLTYTVQVDDHHGGLTSKDVVVTVTGANDAPTVTASNGAFTEMAGTGNAALDHAGGSISFADLDLSDRPDVSTSFSGYTYKAADGITDLSLTAQQQGGLGVALKLTPAGGNTNTGSVSWSYDVADNQFDFLAAGETLTLTYTATVNDHHGGLVTKPVTVTITGTNDAPTLAAEFAGELTDTAAYDSFDNLTGTLAGNDVDHGETASLTLRRARRIQRGQYRGRRPLRLADGTCRRHLHLRSQCRRDQCAARWQLYRYLHGANHRRPRRSPVRPFSRSM